MLLFLPPRDARQWVIAMPGFSRAAATEKICDSWPCYLACYLGGRRTVATQISGHV